jgi:hypothetical protein
MLRSITKYFLIVVCILLLMGASAYAGWYLAVNPLLNNWVQEQSGDVSGHVEVLGQLRTGHYNAAIEILESQLDADLIVLVPEDLQLQPPVETQTRLAIQAARQYRDLYPRQSDNAGIQNMVNNVLYPPAEK